MKSSCFWWMVLNCLAQCWQSAPCFVPQVYGIGVAKIGLQSLLPTVSFKWCDNVMLCGRAPLSLRMITVTTTADRIFQVIEKDSSTDLWLLSASDGINTTTSIAPVIEHFQNQHRILLDFSLRNFPETDSDWCWLVLKFAYRRNWKPDADVVSPLDVRVSYVLSTMKYAMLNKVVVIFDESTELEASRLSEGLSDLEVLHTLRRKEALGPGESPWDVHFRGSLMDFEEFTNIILWCGSNCVNKSLNDILGHSDSYLSSDIVIYHMTRILIVDTSIQSNGSFTDANNQSESHSQMTSSAIGGGADVRERINGILKRVQGFYHVAVLWKEADCVRLQTLTTRKGGIRQFSYAGFGDNLGHMMLTSEVFPNTKWRLNGEKLIVGTTVWAPFVMVENISGTPQYSGLCIDILKALSLSLNFTYELRQPKDGQFGSVVNGNWTGLIKMLDDREVQMVVAPLAVNELRAALVDFTTPFYLDYTGVLFKRPDPAPHKWKTYFRPFRFEVLIYIGASFLVATTFGHVVGVVSANVLGSGQPGTTIMDTVQYFFGSLLAQGGVWNPTTASARLFVSAWWLFSVVMAAIYSGNLTASLAVSWYSPSFSTLQQMIDAGAYRFGSVPGTIWFDIFKFSNRSDFQAINHEMHRLTQNFSPEKIDEIAEHVALAQRGHYAYIGNIGSLRVTLQDNCDLMILEETFLPMHYSIALVKGSPLTSVISRWILRMNEGGLGDFWASQWWRTDNFTCELGKKTDAKTLSIEDCQTAFFILLAGLAVALLAIFSEVVVHCVRGRKHGGQSPSENHREIATAVSQRRSSNVAVLKTTSVYSTNGAVPSVTLSDMGGSLSAVSGGSPQPYVNGFYRTCGEVDSRRSSSADLDVRL